MSDPRREPASRRGSLVGFLLGWTTVMLGWAAVLSVAFLSLNSLSLADAVPLYAFWAGTYLGLSVPVVACIGVVAAFLGAGARRGALFGMGCAAAFLVCLNLLFRWAVAYHIVSPRAVHLVPLGGLDLVVLLVAFVTLVTGLARAVQRPRVEASALGWLGLGSVLLVATHLLNVWYERPSRVDVQAAVSPLIPASEPCAASSSEAQGLVFLALDGFTWNVAAPLLEQGKLPHLRKLLARSAYGHLETLEVSYSPVVWATVATGLDEEAHQIHGFLRFQLPGVSVPIYRGPRLNSFTWWGGSNSLLFAWSELGVVRSQPLPSTRRTPSAIWEIAGANGRTVGLYDWMNSWPVDRVPGYMFTNTGRRPKNAYPAQAVHDVLAGVTSETDGAPSRLVDKGARNFAQAYALFRRFEPNVSFHFNKVLDRSHEEWRNKDRFIVAPLDRPYRSFREEIVHAYELADLWIGRFLEVTPEDYAFVIASDHGFEFNGTVHVFAPPGAIVLSGPPFACGRVIEGADVYDVAPTLLAVLGLPGLEAMPGEVLRSALRSPVGDPRLERVAGYPEDWRALPASDAETDEESWDDLMERLRAMGYVN